MALAPRIINLLALTGAATSYASPPGAATSYASPPGAAVELASPAKILAFGDSWAWLGYQQFKDVFAKHNVTTALHAIPGTPAGYWALVQPHALVRAVDAAGADAVYLSIGGNDFLEGLPAGHLVPLLFGEMMAATQAMIDRLSAE